MFFPGSVLCVTDYIQASAGTFFYWSWNIFGIFSLFTEKLA